MGWGDIWNKAVNVAESAKDQAKSTAQGYKDQAAAAVEGAKDQAQGYKDQAAAAVEGAKDQAEGYKDQAKSTVQGFKDQAEGYKDQVKSTAQGYKDQAKSTAQGYKDQAEGYKDQVKSTAQGYKDQAKSTAQGYKDQASATARGYKSDAEGRASAAIATYRAEASIVSSAPPGVSAAKYVPPQPPPQAVGCFDSFVAAFGCGQEGEKPPADEVAKANLLRLAKDQISTLSYKEEEGQELDLKKRAKPRSRSVKKKSAQYSSSGGAAQAPQIALKPTPNSKNYANCGGIYTLIEEDVNGQPLFQNQDGDRYLGYCGSAWVVNGDASTTRNGQIRGYHWSEERRVEDLDDNTLAQLGKTPSYTIITDPAAVAAIVADGKKLFKGGIDPNDINQGTLGDCWLLGSIASLAEFPDLVMNLFESTEPDEDENYTVKLYDVVRKEWTKVKSHAKSSPYAHSKSGEKWVVVLERAFANMFGGYKTLSGNSGGLALQMLTGGLCLGVTREGDDSWKYGDMRPADDFDYDDDHCRKFYTWYKYDTPNESDDAVWSLLVTADQRNCIMNCSRDGRDDFSETGSPKGAYGMVDGHLYSLIQVKEVEGHRLIQCRNPWGSTEWGGDWSDRSSKWEEFPSVAQTLQWSPDAKDGLFWIAFDDWKDEFGRFVVCTLDPNPFWK